ncbi:MAG: hypothetical protein RLY93_17715 [Sumerlaeia bacterium]
MSIFRSGQPSNPFATRHWGPGNVTFLFPEGESLDGLLARLDEAGWHAELVGDHGVGKSTLLATLREAAEARGWPVLWCKMRQVSPRLPWGWQWRWRRARVVFLDSGELLPGRQWRALARWATRGGRGLVVTLHAPKDWGLRVDLAPRAETFAALLSHLLRRPIAQQAAARWLEKHATPRQALFALYEAYEEDAAVTLADLTAPRPHREEPPTP